MKEIKSLRKRREKHFENEDGTITAYMYNEDIHYLCDGVYRQIDNKLIDKGNYYENEYNEFKVNFSKEDDDLLSIKSHNHHLKMFLLNSNNIKLEKDKEDIKYSNILNDVDIDYKVISNKVKESIILKNKDNYPSSFTFFIETDLELFKDNKKIIASSNNETIYTIDVPFMIDNNKETNDNLDYRLTKVENGYNLKLDLDANWLNSAERVFPVVVDPTIANIYGSEYGENVFDTHIFSKDPDRAFNYNSLYIGTDSDGTYRTLMKFVLPEIKTGFSIVDSRVVLSTSINSARPSRVPERKVSVHKITTQWDEYTASWNTMNDKYDSKIETFFTPNRRDISDQSGTIYSTDIDITNLVKKWYSGEPNNGIMLKWINEEYEDNLLKYIVYSKEEDIIKDENDTKEARRPYLTITYKNQTGLVSYMDYTNIDFTYGTAYINNRNGNFVSLFNLISTLSSKLSSSLGIVYNTSDVLETGINSIAKGWKFSLEESLEEETIHGINWIKYIDSTGANHYFCKNNENEEYIDEDGLSLKITALEEKYEMSDKNGNKKIFTKIDEKILLTKIIDVEGNEINIEYLNGKLYKIIDASKEEINITYEENRIVLKTTNESSKINISDNRIISLENKLGKISFVYNSNGLINKIIDTNSLSKTIEYYEANPYKVKKITEYSITNEVGKSLSFEYGYSTTSLTDNDGQKTVYTFNNNGSTINTAMFSNNENKLSEAYANEKLFNQYSEFTSQKNKPAAIKESKRYVENLLMNSSFEEELDKCNFTFDGEVERVNHDANSGNYSLRMTDQTYAIIFDIDEFVPYTVSFYLKNPTNNNNVDANLILINTRGTREFADSTFITNLGEYKRYTLTAAPNRANVKSLSLEFNIPEGVELYLDDLQLERGRVANLRNLVSNSNFSKGFEGWTLRGENQEAYQILTTPDNEKYLTINSHPEKEYTVSYDLKINGKKGETYELSFWYKNEGITPILEGYELQGNFVNIQVSHINGEYGMCTNNIYLEPHTTEWQYFTTTFVSQADFESAFLNILSIREANSLSITNFMVVKDSRTITYEYDEEGNLIKVNGLNNESNQFNYDENNQLISSFTPKGSNFKYEYDNKVTTRLRKGISPTGISNEIKYDKFGNATKTIINNVNPDNTIIDGNSYEIRLKGTDKYLSCDFNRNIVDLLESTCSHQSFKVTLHEIQEGLPEENTENLEGLVPTKYYRFTIGYKHLTYIGERVVLTDIKDDKSLFKLLLCENGSYVLVPKTDNELNMTFKDGILKVSKKDKNDYDNQFYFEDIDTPLYIENKSYYTKDGKFVTRVVDSLGKETKYDIDDKTGLVKSVTNAKDVTTSIIYTPEFQTKGVRIKDKVIDYEYNDSKLLTKIKSGKKEYNFDYDDFLRTKTVSIGNQTLINHEYEPNNGNLLKSTYGNGDYVSYAYDELNRVKTITINGLNYEHSYDNSGNLANITRTTFVTGSKEYHKYMYDLANRLEKYISPNLSIKYDYDSNNNVIKKEYEVEEKLYPSIHTVNYEYNKDDSITKVEINGNVVKYNYDYLGRLINKNINDNLQINYTYITNGEKTSLILNTYTIGNETYKYEYDELYNITKIFINDELTNEYFYDDINELISEKNHSSNRKYEYVYDSEGNIEVKKEYNLTTDETIKVYNYEYNNPNWEDELTKFNDTEITYDEIGNPITIGDATLTWNAGRRLETYKNSELDIKYQYNINGIRTRKVVNNVGTAYYLEGNNIVVEKRSNDMIYYIYDSNEIIGLKYKDQTYFYKKNYQGDIIGLYNSNYEQIVTYNYDSWGKVLSVTDQNNNEITDSNHIGLINPFRYRSYYYDEETKFYYLNSRYYNPEWGRFINIDEILFQNKSNLLGNNLFLYVENNPINFMDDTGKAIAKFKYSDLYEYSYQITGDSEKDYYEVEIFIADNPCPYKYSYFGGSLHFSFEENYYYDREDAFTLANAFLEIYPLIYEKELKRGITGLKFELNLHYDLYKLTKNNSDSFSEFITHHAKEADMGSYDPRVDRDALIFSIIGIATSPFEIVRNSGVKSKKKKKKKQEFKISNIFSFL